MLIFNIERDKKLTIKKVKREEFFKNEFTRKFIMLETNISENSLYIIKNNFNIADIALWSFVN